LLVTTCAFEVVILRIWEVIDTKAKKTSAAARHKNTKPTNFEKNLSKLRGKERSLRPQTPVKPVSHAA